MDFDHGRFCKIILFCAVLLFIKTCLEGNFVLISSSLDDKNPTLFIFGDDRSSITKLRGSFPSRWSDRGYDFMSHRYGFLDSISGEKQEKGMDAFASQVEDFRTIMRSLGEASGYPPQRFAYRSLIAVIVGESEISRANMSLNLETFIQSTIQQYQSSFLRLEEIGARRFVVGELCESEDEKKNELVRLFNISLRNMVERLNRRSDGENLSWMDKKLRPRYIVRNASGQIVMESQRDKLVGGFAIGRVILEKALNYVYCIFKSTCISWISF